MKHQARYEDELFHLLKGLGDPTHAGRLIREDATEVVETFDAPKEIAAVVASHPAKTSSVTLRNCFHHPDAHPLLLDVLLLRKYGPEFLGWEVETLEHHIPKDFGTSAVSHVNLAKIQACRALHNVDSPWERWEVFTWVAVALNGIPPDFEVLQIPTVAQALVAIDIADRVRQDVPWAREVEIFVDALFRHDGVFFELPPADFLHIIAPNVDRQAIQARWPSIRASRTIPTDETIEGEQLRRLLTVHEYVLDHQERLLSQLEILRQ
jgi:hypothetical protein